MVLPPVDEEEKVSGVGARGRCGACVSCAAVRMLVSGRRFATRVEQAAARFAWRGDGCDTARTFRS